MMWSVETPSLIPHLLRHDPDLETQGGASLVEARYSEVDSSFVKARCPAVELFFDVNEEEVSITGASISADSSATSNIFLCLV